jgi:trk system potassium uptake protein TrkH
MNSKAPSFAPGRARIRNFRYSELGIILSLLILIGEFFSTQRGVPITQDFAALFVSLLLLRQALRKDLRNPENWRTQLFRISTSVCISFYLLWWSRWAGGARVAQISPLASQERAYLQLGTLLAFLNFLSLQNQIRNWWRNLEVTPGRKILGMYLIACLAGSAFLILPWTHLPGKTVQLIDALFITVSALSVTGLSPLDIATHFTLPGLTAIVVMIQLGGWGVVAVSVALVMLTRARLSLSESQMGLELYDIPETGRFNDFLKKVMKTSLILEGMGAVAILTSLPLGTENAWFHALFLSISSFCNAGFSSLPANLENPITLFPRFPIGALILLGGIGFPILFEAHQAFCHWKQEREKLKATSSERKQKGRTAAKPHRSFTTHFVLTLSVSTLLLFGGWFALSLTELLHEPKILQGWDLAGQALFYSISARTAGFNIIPVDQLAFSSQIILVFLMVIGGSPLSTAGGIKTTTAGVIVASVWNFLRGRNWIQFMNREISWVALQKSVTILTLYSCAAFLALLLMLVTEDLDAWALTFEIVSALSTTGLSVGATGALTVIGKLIVSALMLTGRIGLITVAVASLGRTKEQKFRYPVGRFYIG